MSENKETKKYVTAFAFSVDDAVLGKALDSPKRRLCSMIIDLIVVGSLTLMSAMFFAVVVLGVSLVGIIKSKARQKGGMAQTVFMFSAVLSIVFITASLMFGDFSKLDRVYSKGETEKLIVTTTTIVNNTDQDSKVEPKSNERSYSFIDYIKGFMIDMGLGFGWAALYFSVFIAWFDGQTIGKMIFRIKVIKIDSKPLSFWQSFERYGGYSAGLATGLLGFLQVIWDPNRQAIHDKISETVVLDLSKPNRVD